MTILPTFSTIPLKPQWECAQSASSLFGDISCRVGQLGQNILSMPQAQELDATAVFDMMNVSGIRLE